jgi:predicted RNA-binding protein
MEKIFRCGKLGLGDMDEKALVLVIMLEGLIAVNGEHREDRDELQALAENVGNGGVIGIFIVCVERENASGKDIHHIFAGRFEDHIAHEGGRQAAVFREGLTESFQLFHIGKLGEEKKISCFFKTEAVIVQEAFDKVAYVDAAVCEDAVDGSDVAVFVNDFGLYVGDLCETGHDAVTFKVAQTAENVVMKNVMAIECKDGCVILTDLMERTVALEGTLVSANLVDGYVIVKTA